jgi:cytochrome P450 / NADPH-cytochrome P450 reductase
MAMVTTHVPDVGVMTMMRKARSRTDETLIELLMDLTREYGQIFQLPGTGPRNLIVSSFELVDELCDDQRFDKTLGAGQLEVRGLLGDGLFTAWTCEPNWRKARNILLPAFSRQAMKGYMPQMLDLAIQLMFKWQRRNPAAEIDAPDDMTRLTLDTIGLCGFGYRCNSFYGTDQHPFVTTMVDALTKVTERQAGALGADARSLAGDVVEALTRWIRPAPVERDPLSSDPALSYDRQAMNSLVDQVIRARKAHGPEVIAARGDLLSYMLTRVDKQSGERLDDATIRYEILTFLIAGHAATSSLLSFALYLLLKHPAVLARAYDEVDRVLGRDPRVLPTYEQVNYLSYVAQILKETLRLWPPAPAFTRAPLHETTLGGLYPITPQDRITILTIMLHRDPSVWGDDAEQFNPDHFSPEAERARPANAYKPFGTGRRACIGREFAMQEATLVLGMLLQRFELIDHTDYHLQLKHTLTIKPAKFKIKVRSRTQLDLALVAATTATTSGERDRCVRSS